MNEFFRKKLGFGNVGCLQAFRSLGHFKVHLVTLIQSLVSVADDFLEMDEHVFAGLALYKPEALGSVEPFYGTRFHVMDPFND